MEELTEKNVAVGILSRQKDSLEKFKQHFQNDPSIHCLSFYEAQGVEFDCVFIVGEIQKPLTYEGLTDELQAELKAIEKDLLYVALTRAISKLYILS